MSTSTMVDSAKGAVKRNVSVPMVVSTAIGVCVAGAAVYFAAKSGFKPLVAASKVAKGGAK